MERVWKKLFFPLVLGLLLCLSLLPAAFAAGEEGPVLQVGTGGAARGETFTLEVTLSGGQAVWGGGLEAVYDPDALTLLQIEAGGLMEGVLFQSNPAYTGSSARITFAGTAPLEPEGTVCTLTFQVKADAPLGNTPVALAGVRLYDENAQACPVTTVDGQGQAWYSGLAVQSAEGVRGQSVRVELALEGELDPAGGGFTIVYDPEQMTAGSVVAAPLLQGYSLVSNEAEPGRIRVTWAGSRALESRGTFCTVTFHISQQAGGAPKIALENLRAYDEDARALSTAATAGEVTLLTPTESSPKIWIVGGAIDPAAKTASVDVVLEGRGTICGGRFTLSYPTGSCTLIDTQIQAVNGVVNLDTPGTVLFSWADTMPVSGSQALLRLEFQMESVAAVPLELSQAQMFYSDGSAAVNVDIRSGKLLPDSLTYQAPVVDTATVTFRGDGQTQVEAVLDVAAAQLPSNPLARSAFAGTDAPRSLMVAFYEGGQLKSLSQQELAITLDENGIAQITLSAACAGTADQLRLFLLGEGGTWIPLSEDLWYQWEVEQP